MIWKIAKKAVSDKDPISDDFIDLVNGLLTYDPEKRYTMEQVLEHKWMKGQMPTK